MFSPAVRSGSVEEIEDLAIWMEMLQVNPELMKRYAHSENNRGETPLLNASKLKHMEIVKYLVEHYEVDVNQEGKLWWNSNNYELSIATALHVAVILGHEILYLAGPRAGKGNLRTAK